MPYARNALDGNRVYFEDDGGDEPTHAAQVGAARVKDPRLLNASY